mmetsp:Transcript_34053/g.56389  ORF Transcript_34053/g.56389 Transcript_34053/m.56389 type:complete len:90 (+) Transcript_34053:1260-1529(+)
MRIVAVTLAPKWCRVSYSIDPLHWLEALLIGLASCGLRKTRKSGNAVKTFDASGFVRLQGHPPQEGSAVSGADRVDAIGEGSCVAQGRP